MLTRRVAWAVAIVATLTMTVSYIDRSTFAVLAPSVTEALGLTEQDYGWLTAAFSISYLVATPIAGWWIDRIGARKGLVQSVLVWSLVAGLHALVPGFGVLLALRIALGAAEGPSFPGAAQTVQRALPVGDQARGFGVLFTGSSIGGMLVPPLATLLYWLAGWRVAFLGTTAIGLLWIPLWIALTRRPDVRAQLEAPTPGPSGARLGFGSLVGDPRMVRALCGVFAIAPVLGFLQAWGAKYLVRAHHLEQGDVGRYLWLPPLVFDVCAIGFGDLASRRRTAAGSSPLALHAIATVLAMALVLTPLATSPWQAIVVFSVSMGGGGALYTLVTADVLGRMPSRSVSFAGGILAGAQSLAFVVSNPLIGRTVDRLHDYDAVTVTLGLWVAPGSLIWLVTGAVANRRARATR